jgi:hypothetical protein
VWSGVLRNKKWLYWFFLFLAIIASFAIKFAALNRYAAPPGADYGNFLTQVNILNGHDVVGLGLRYNPLFFIVLDPFLIFFAQLTALKVVASLVFSIVAIPFFLLAKKLSNSYVAALVASCTFLFFEGYSEMIGWGGNPNFLGFSFMLLTLFFLVNSLEKSSKKNLLLTGFSLSLVVGVHFLVTAFVFLFFFVFAILTLAFNRKNLSRNIKILLSIIGISVVFSLLYIPVYVVFVRDSSSGLVNMNFLKAVNAAIAGLEWMFRDQYLIMIPMAALGVLALLIHARRNRDDSLILGSLFLLPFILALFTEDPDRWFYFLPIPVMLSFALFLGKLFAAIRNKRKLVILLASGFVLLIIVGTTITGVARLETSVDFYQTIGNDELRALNWIRNETNLNATFATSGSNKNIGGGGNSYSWWIEGYSERKCIPSGPPALYSYSDEVNEVEVANRIFAGTYTFEYGNVRVSENSPAGMGNPEIAAYIDGQYQNLLFLSDGEEPITFSPVGNNQTIWNEAPLYAANKTTELHYNETWANMTFSYEWPSLKVTRSTIMNSGQSSVDIIFDLMPINSTLRQFTVNIWGAFYTSLESFEIQNSSIILQQKLQTGDQVETKIEVVGTNGEIDNAQVFVKDPQYSMPLATYSLKPLQHDLSVHLRVSILTETSEPKNNTISFYNSYDLIKDLGIDYIFLNKGRTIEYNRFLSDSEHFKVVFENGSIVIFRVVSGDG